MSSRESEKKPEVKLYESVHAGFPSPAEDIPGTALDINKLVVKNPASTFFARVSGDSMEWTSQRSLATEPLPCVSSTGSSLSKG